MSKKTKIQKVVHAVNKDIDTLTEELVTEKNAIEIEDLEEYKESYSENFKNGILDAD